MLKLLSSLLLSIIVSLTAVTFAFACSCGCKGNNCGASQQSTVQDVVEEKVQCPVTKKWFIPNEKTPRTTYKGKEYKFCCSRCKGKFLENPALYISKS